MPQDLSPAAQAFVETGNGAYVGDALAHLANADDADFFDV